MCEDQGSRRALSIVYSASPVDAILTCSINSLSTNAFLLLHIPDMIMLMHFENSLPPYPRCPTGWRGFGFHGTFSTSSADRSCFTILLVCVEPLLKGPGVLPASSKMLVDLQSAVAVCRVLGSSIGEAVRESACNRSTVIEIRTTHLAQAS